MNDPFIISFHRDADGGPLHVLHLLRGYGVTLMKNGEAVLSGHIVDTADYEFVRIKKWCDECGDHCGATVDVNLFDGTFDEVVYL